MFEVNANKGVYNDVYFWILNTSTMFKGQTNKGVYDVF